MDPDILIQGYKYQSIIYDCLYSTILLSLTHESFQEDESKSLWNEIISHKRQLNVTPNIKAILAIQKVHLTKESILRKIFNVDSRQLILWTYPKTWLEKARKKLEHEAGSEEESFDWRKQIRSAKGWRLVGHKFFGEWAMVWEEIVIGFTIAAFVAVLVPDAFWKNIFLAEKVAESPIHFPVVLENALLAPCRHVMSLFRKLLIAPSRGLKIFPNFRQDYNIEIRYDLKFICLFFKPNFLRRFFR